ncbi:Uncharacterized protein FWK35_00030944, partial [Aphis craccivora]
MSFRKHESYALKRRAQKNRKDYETNISKLSNFFQPIKNLSVGPKMTEVVQEIDTNTNE